MTIPIVFTKIRPERMVSGFSRYVNQNIIYYGEQKFLTFDIYIRKMYKPTGKEKIMVITKGVEYRPDLVSYDVYGIPDAWWRILQANGMKDVWEFKTGVTIRIPEMI
jgi:hypothetical protein